MKARVFLKDHYTPLAHPYTSNAPVQSDEHWKLYGVPVELCSVCSTDPLLPCINCNQFGRDHNGSKCLFGPGHFQAAEKCDQCNMAAMWTEDWADYYYNYCSCPAGQLARELSAYMDHIRDIEAEIPWA